MKRLTYDFCVAGNHCWQIKGADNLECREVCQQMEEKGGCKACQIANAFNRLAAIENILGDDYDLDRLRELLQADRDDDLNLETDRPRIDFVDRAEKELQKAANDLEQAARRGAPKSDIFNLQRKVEYKQYVLGLLKGR